MVNAAKIQEANRFLTEAQVSRITGRACSTLQKDRFYRRGIPYLKIGRAVRYRAGDVLAYMRAHKIDPQRLRLVE